MYFGTIVDINDPEQLGRVKVRVYHLHDNIPTEELGWSIVMMPANTPAISGQGHSVNLNSEVLWKEGEVLPNGVSIGDIKIIGSLVCCRALDNETQQEFLVMGSLPTKTDGAFDNNERVRSINPHADEPSGEYEPTSAFAPVYPYNNVYETASGHAKEYDDTLGYERIMERHMSGTQYEIQPNGSKIERIVRDNYQLVVGHDTLEVFGNVRIVVSGQADIAVANDVNLAVGGNLTADITGNMTANITGTTSLIGVDDIKIDVTGSGKKITLDGDVDVTGDLRLTAEGITLNTHTHGQNNVNQPNTAGPNAN